MTKLFLVSFVLTLLLCRVGNSVPENCGEPHGHSNTETVLEQQHEDDPIYIDNVVVFSHAVSYITVNNSTLRPVEPHYSIWKPPVNS